MPGLGITPASGRVAATSTVPPPGPTSSSVSSSSASSPFAVCYVNPKGNSSATRNRNGFSGTTATNNNNVGENSNDEKPKLDPSDPRVKKLVYSMYRDMLTSRNTEANDIIGKKDPTKVTQDYGVGPILESIIIRQRGSQGGSDSPGGPISSDCPTDGEPANGSSTMAPPPPPPPMMPGAIPAVRLTSEIGPRDKGPPAALAGAMMKDKKPFTYTPGGIDLSEIRSPRMAKRIQMNAAAEGVTNTPTPSSSGNQERAPCQLPPAAMAAMQPQMAFPVFPQGNMNAVQLNKSHKPADYAGNPPPPPPMSPMSVPVFRQPPPPPPAAPVSPQPNLLNQPLSPPIPKSPPPPRTPPPPPERAATPKSPLPPSDSYYGNSQSNSQPSYLEERRSPLGRKSPAMESGLGAGTLFIPPIQNSPQNQAQSPPPPKSPSPISTYVPPSARPAGQTKAQAVSQNIGSLYIPPIGGQTQPSNFGGNTSNGSANISRNPQPATQSQPTPQSTPSVPATPQLNKAPIPWMNSYNRMQNQQADSPPYVHPGFFMPPWGPPPGVRNIPIMMGRESDQPDSGSGPSMTSPFQGAGTESRRSSSGSSTPSGSRTPSQAAAHLGRVIPIQIEREETGRSKGAKVIPIQIEGRPPRMQTPMTPTTPGMNPMRRVAGPPPYNSPMGLYSNQNAMDAYQRQAAEAAAGVDKMTVRCESPRMDPMQSKSMRVIQQAAENELKRIEQEQGQRSLDLSEDDAQLMNLLQAQVHEGSSLHQTAEPRFMGGHIPSRAFRALQTALPTSPGAQDQPPPSYPAAATASGGPVTHHIPIRQAVSPTPPQSQSSEIQLGSQQAYVPASEQKVQEPKKYMGSNIPSRSFKILQQMTADDGSGGDQPAVDSVDETALEQNITDSYTDDVDDTYSRSSGENFFPPFPTPFYSPSQSSYPLSLSCSSEGGGSATFDPSNCNNNNSLSNNDSSINDTSGGYVDDGSSSWPNNQQQGWDAYSYMWYYWWYYSSYYWAGYDMTGYEYPAGFDPNYCPPEFFSDYSNFGEYTAADGTDLENAYTQGVSNVDADAGNYYSTEREKLEDEDRIPLSGVPGIVIEDGDGDREKSNVGVDSIKDNDSCLSNNSKIAPSPSPSSPLTECNKKPGILSTLPYKKNGCDKSMDAKDNDDDHNAEAALSSESDDEYESCCEDSEQKVIERETGPCNNNSKPFVSSQNFAGHLGESVERKFERNNGNYNSELNANYHGAGGGGSGEKRNKWEGDCEDDVDDDEEEDEKTDPGTDEDNDDQDDYGGKVAIIEEPETASSADDSDATILGNRDEQRSGKPSYYYESSGLSIEEYHSEESSDSAVFDYGLGKNRLSTIDEITESRASSSLLSFNSCDSSSTSTVKNSSTGLNNGCGKKNYGNSNSLADQQNNGGGESEDSEESSDELSSVSVIENKSDATRGTTESKREDEITSTSEEEDSSTDDDDDNGNAKVGESSKGGQDLYEEDEEDGDGTDTAVTVRLPLKLCFTKTKSYRDITTVMVGDSEIEETSQVSMASSSSSSSCSNEDEPKLVVTTEENEMDKEDDYEEEEPVVSFTLSLSRQTSKEDEMKLRAVINTDCDGKKQKSRVEDESDDIDFWAQIGKGEKENNNFKRNSPATARESEREHEKGNEKSKEQKEDYEVKETAVGDEPDVSFWGVITRDGSATDFVRMRNKVKQQENEEENYSSQGWDLCESIEYKWEQDFNFWEKSSRTIETRRFSGNFEITEDYESDSGIKPSTGKKERVKKYTHHKRHSIPGPGAWDSRSSLPPRPTPRQFTSSSKSPHHSGFNSNEQEIKEGEGKFDDASSKYRKGKGVEEGKRSESLSERQTADTYQEDTDTSSWWSYWDEVSSKQNEDEEKLEINEDDAFATTAAATTTSTTSTTSTATTEKEMESGVVFRRKKTAPQWQHEDSSATVDDISVEIKLSGAGVVVRTSAGESTGGEEDYQSFASSTGVQASRMEQGGSGGGSFKRKNGDSSNERKSLNQSCQSDATDNEDYSSFSPEIKSSSLLFPSSCNQEEAVTTEKLNQQGSSSISVSDENSDESSRSSGTTIGRHDKNEINHHQQQQIPPTTSSSDSKADSESHLKGPKKGDEEEVNTSLLSPNAEESIEIPVTVERNVEIQYEYGGGAAGDRAKLNGRQQYQEDHQHLHTVQHHHHHHHHTSSINAGSSSTTSTTTCTCLMGDRIARAENLLWRIERFLHESLSLGSEDDSGVMTDLSRQISDVDTDVDNDLNETEFLLTAATAAKERRGVAFTTPPPNTGSTPEPTQHIESCSFGETISSTEPQPPQSSFTSSSSQQQQQSSNNNNSATNITSQQVKRPRPKSDIFCESTLLSKVELEETTQSTSATVEENNGNGVKMRSASERRALRYQRAKTHSRLFQLLQDECGRDEEQDEFDYESDVGTLTSSCNNNNNSNMSAALASSTNNVCQISVDTGSSTATTGGIHQYQHHHQHQVMDDDSNSNSNNESCSGTSPTRMNDAQARRSRLLPLPIKNLLASSLSLDSNSSPSGSSGVLSPTSPVNRDQLLADIINEFHLRNQASTIRAQSQRRISSSFPSKIFKLLQHEFGEEFYQTFDCCGGSGGMMGEDSLISPSMSTNLCVNDPTTASPFAAGAASSVVHDCTIHKSESMKEFEEATNRILTNFMLRNTSSTSSMKPKASAESPSSTATQVSPTLLQDDSKNCCVDFLDVPMRRKKGNLNRDPRSPKSTKKS